MSLRAYFNKSRCFPIFLGAFAMLFLVSSCKRLGYSHDEKIVSVAEEVLYKSDLQSMLPVGMLPADSADASKKIIENWVLQQVLLQKAKKNTDVSEDYYKKQIEDYKNSLIIFTYQNRVAEQLLDTIVSEQELEDYYKANSEQFYLKSNIVKVRFAKVLRNDPDEKKIKKELFSEPFSERNLIKLSNLCAKSADNYFLDTDQWLFFNDLLREIPIKTYDQEEFLSNHHQIEVVSGKFIYYVVILDFRVRDMVSPFPFERNRIRLIILNKRKQAILQEMRDGLLKEAEQAKEIKYY